MGWGLCTPLSLWTSSGHAFFVAILCFPLLFCVNSPSAMELWMMGQAPERAGGLQFMLCTLATLCAANVLSDGNGTAALFGSYQGDWAAPFWIHTAHLQWRRGLEKVAQKIVSSSKQSVKHLWSQAGMCALCRTLGWELGVAPSSLPVSLPDISLT